MDNRAALTAIRRARRAYEIATREAEQRPSRTRVAHQAARQLAQATRALMLSALES